MPEDELDAERSPRWKISAPQLEQRRQVVASERVTEIVPLTLGIPTRAAASRPSAPTPSRAHRRRRPWTVNRATDPSPPRTSPPSCVPARLVPPRVDPSRRAFFKGAHEIRDPPRPSPPPPQVQNLLSQMQSRFQQMSDSIITRIDEMGERIDDLEKSVGDLIQQAEEDGKPEEGAKALSK